MRWFLVRLRRKAAFDNALPPRMFLKHQSSHSTIRTVAITLDTQTSQTLELDLATLASAFCQRLHEGDMPVTPARSEQYARSLQLVKPDSRQRLYLTTRAVFVTDFEQVETFDRVFADVFGSSDIEPAPPAAYL